MTSSDRHASHDSPYRTGQHMPISQSRHAPLTSVATSAVESQPDLHSSLDEDPSKRPHVSSVAVSTSPGHNSSPHRPHYSPGMRSLGSPKKTAADDTVTPGEIQMQSFADGAPPPPPVSHSWKKIDRWLEKNYPELFDQLGEGCTQNDINELEHELDCSLPQDVRESLTVHDGQERGGRPTGVIFSCMLLDCEEIVQEWKNWRKVNEEYLNTRIKPQPEYPIKGLNNASSSSSHQSQSGPNNKLWRQELLDRQDSQPPKAIQKAYAHPGWIPLARDWGGNNIAVDLAPGQMGKWGQVIIFGRDYDCKYVVARSWSHFMAVLADDINSEKTFVVEDSGELKLKEFKTDSVEPGYLDILRWRADQKYGRRVPKRKPQPPSGLNTHINGKSSRDSPYTSPTVSNDERGRSPHRFSRGPNSSPRHQVGSPLARVNEEIVAPVPVRAGGDVVKDFATGAEVRTSTKPEKLVDAPTPVEVSKKDKLIDAPTPVSSTDERGYEISSLSRAGTMPTLDEDKENQAETPLTVKGLGVNGLDDDMKNVQI
jgi:cell wall assembly regulator SMI1